MLYGLDERAAAIYAPVQAGLEQVESKLKGLARHLNQDRVNQDGAPAAVEDLRPLLDYVAETGGKRVRPAITLLASHSYPHDPDKLVLMASAVELLHLATLIHDDTVDDSAIRRGRATVSSLWGHHVSVLFGDYVFATLRHLCLRHRKHPHNAPLLRNHYGLSQRRADGVFRRL